MRFNDCDIDGLKIIELEARRDERGTFTERFNARDFAACGLPVDFAQDNYIHSLPGVLRGLHYQINPQQGKLVSVLRGRVWDVAVDIRPDSKTFGRYFATELSAENGLMLWVPAGFAHGFCVLGDEPCDMVMKVSGIYNEAGAGGISYDDKKLAIEWPVENLIVSARDRQLASWDEYCNNIHSPGGK